MTEFAGQVGCMFNSCPDKYDLSRPMIGIELNVDVDGTLRAHTNHPEADHRGPLIATERVSGVAHVDCYAAWYEQTYRTPFTMSG